MDEQMGPDGRLKSMQPFVASPTAAMLSDGSGVGSSMQNQIVDLSLDDCTPPRQPQVRFASPIVIQHPPHRSGNVPPARQIRVNPVIGMPMLLGAALPKPVVTSSLSGAVGMTRPQPEIGLPKLQDTPVFSHQPSLFTAPTLAGISPTLPTPILYKDPPSIPVLSDVEVSRLPYSPHDNSSLCPPAVTTTRSQPVMGLPKLLDTPLSSHQPSMFTTNAPAHVSPALRTPILHKEPASIPVLLDVEVSRLPCFPHGNSSLGPPPAMRTTRSQPVIGLPKLLDTPLSLHQPSMFTPSAPAGVSPTLPTPILHKEPASIPVLLDVEVSRLSARDGSSSTELYTISPPPVISAVADVASIPRLHMTPSHPAPSNPDDMDIDPPFNTNVEQRPARSKSFHAALAAKIASLPKVLHDQDPSPFSPDPLYRDDEFDNFLMSYPTHNPLELPYLHMFESLTVQYRAAKSELARFVTMSRVQLEVVEQLDEMIARKRQEIGQSNI